MESRKKHIKKQNIISAAIIILGTVLSLIFFGPWKFDQQKDAATQQEPLAKIANVSVIELGKDEEKVARLEKTAVLEPEVNSADVVAEYGGRIQSVNFEIGEYVRENQILAFFDQGSDQNAPKVTYDAAQKSLDLAKDNLEKTEEMTEKSKDLAESAVKIAEIQLKQAKESDDERAEDLAEENLEIAEDQEEQANQSTQLQINSAKLQVQQAQGGLDQARIAYEKTLIKAPISGMIVSKKINQGAYLNPGQSVAQIVKEGKLQAKIYLSPDEISRVKKDDKVKITVGGNEFTGEIFSFSSIASGDNGRFEVLIKTSENLSKEANKNAVVILELRSNEVSGSGFFAPLGAVNIGQQKNTVFIVQQDKAVLRDVETAAIIGTKIEITSGLSEGDLLVVENGKNLQEGQEVKIQ